MSKPEDIQIGPGWVQCGVGQQNFLGKALPSPEGGEEGLLTLDPAYEIVMNEVEVETQNPRTGRVERQRAMQKRAFPFQLLAKCRLRCEASWIVAYEDITDGDAKTWAELVNFAEQVRAEIRAKQAGIVTLHGRVG